MGKKRANEQVIDTQRSDYWKVVCILTLPKGRETKKWVIEGCYERRNVAIHDNNAVYRRFRGIKESHPKRNG